jgi:hypothetical protein
MNQQFQISTTEIKRAFHIVWLVFSIVAFVIVMVSIFVNNHAVLSMSPTCASMKYLNKECILCGMTRAFIAIGDFRWSAAYQLNRGSILLYLLFCANSVVFITLSLMNKIHYSKNSN